MPGRTPIRKPSTDPRAVGTGASGASPRGSSTGCPGSACGAFVSTVAHVLNASGTASRAIAKIAKSMPSWSGGCRRSPAGCRSEGPCRSRRPRARAGRQAGLEPRTRREGGAIISASSISRKYSAAPKATATSTRSGESSISPTRARGAGEERAHRRRREGRARPAPPGHLVAVDRGDDTGHLTRGTDERGGDRPAVHRPVVDGTQHDQAVDGLQPEGERDQQRDRGDRTDAGSTPTTVPMSTPINAKSSAVGVSAWANPSASPVNESIAYPRSPGGSCTRRPRSNSR